jgi:hypothetical protein
MRPRIAVIDTILPSTLLHGDPNLWVSQYHELDPPIGGDNHGSVVLSILRSALPTADILFFGVLNLDGYCDGLALYRALRAVREVDAVNLSLAVSDGPGFILLERELARIAAEGARIVAAAFNSGGSAGPLFHSSTTLGVISTAQANRLGISAGPGRKIVPCDPIVINGRIYQGTSYTVPQILCEMFHGCDRPV